MPIAPRCARLRNPPPPPPLFSSFCMVGAGCRCDWGACALSAVRRVCFAAVSAMRPSGWSPCEPGIDWIVRSVGSASSPVGVAPALRQSPAPSSKARFGRVRQVRRWQELQERSAKERGYVLTMLGRMRKLPDAQQKGNAAAMAHALRAAINTPIQVRASAFGKTRNPSAGPGVGV
jgi:hypothetical protein